jgi:nicotinate-nucleotide pyrophosphorylase (carboxylating)
LTGAPPCLGAVFGGLWAFSPIAKGNKPVEIPSSVLDTIRRALEEDLGAGDITTSLLISEEDESKAIYVANGNFILAGFPFAREVFRIIDSSIEWRLLFPEGSTVSNGEILAEISGKTRAILAGERVSLNILQRLSGIATLTDMYVERIKGSKAKIIDTRKRHRVSDL